MLSLPQDDIEKKESKKISSTRSSRQNASLPQDDIEEGIFCSLM